MKCGMSGRIGKMGAVHAEVCQIDFRLSRDLTDLYYARGAQGVLPMRLGGVTSQLDLPSVMPLTVAGFGRLQLEVPHCATSVDYCK